MWESFVNIFINILLYIYKLTGNFGIAIILFTILIKVVIYPLMRSQIKSSAAMMELQKSPEYIEMQERFGGDKEKLAEEQMKLYRKAGVNPTASCLPTLIQLPIIFALYQAIIAAIVSTPLGMLDLSERVYTNWIRIGEIFPINPTFLWMNLGQRERLFVEGIPFGIPVLAILVVLTTLLQTRLTQNQTPSGGDGGGSGMMMSGMMNIYMPLLMGYMSYTLASGLALYFLISNIFTVLQYGIEGKLDWAALKFWVRREAPKAVAKPVRRPSTAGQSKASTAAQKPAAPADPMKIDPSEFKNKKKPKKKVQ